MRPCLIKGAADKSRGELSAKTIPIGYRRGDRRLVPTGHKGKTFRCCRWAGQMSGYAQAKASVDGYRAGFVIAGKGYDSDAFIETIKGSGGIPLIPPRGNRKASMAYDKAIHKEHNLVECLFQKLKQYRRVAIRYEQWAVNYMTMPNLACILIRFNEKTFPGYHGPSSG